MLWVLGTVSFIGFLILACWGVDSLVYDKIMEVKVSDDNEMCK